jgi:hypothetical protein
MYYLYFILLYINLFIYYYILFLYNIINTERQSFTEYYYNRIKNKLIINI